jgi:hypothetical protein
VNLGSRNMDASQVRDGSTGFNRRQNAERVTAIYRESYAAAYASFEPWRRKHELNLHNLAQILDALPNPHGSISPAAKPGILRGSAVERVCTDLI